MGGGGMLAAAVLSSLWWLNSGPVPQQAPLQLSAEAVENDRYPSLTGTEKASLGAGLWNEHPAASAKSRPLIEGVVAPANEGKITAEAAMVWDEKLAALVGLGPQAVPGIRGFLADKNAFEWNAAAQKVLGYRSGREALIDALRKIGGEEAERAMVLTLGETSDPREIGLLAKNLELLAPGRYQPEALEAAKRTLALDPSMLATGFEVAPLFEIFSRYGDASTAALLENEAAERNYYAAYSLGQLPEGAGVPSLARLAESPNSTSIAAVEPAIKVLCSLSSGSELARQAFLDLAQRDRIKASTWAQLVPLLAGAQLQFSEGVFGNQLELDQGMGLQRIHLEDGNQNLRIGMPALVKAEQMERQLAWLDQLSVVVTSPAAKASIHDAWAKLHLRLNPLAANVP